MLAGLIALVALLWTAAIVLGFLLSTAERTSKTNVGDVRAQPSIVLILRGGLFWLAVLFAFVGGAAFESVGALLGPYLQDAALSLEQIGLFQIGPLAGAMALGALFGGKVADRFGHVRVAWCGLLALVLLNLTLGLTEMAEDASSAIRLPLIIAVYVVIGIFTASSYALFMDLAQGRWQATVFSALMGVTNACEAGSAYASGWLAAAFGYSATFIMMTVPSVVGLAILPLLRRRS